MSPVSWRNRSISPCPPPSVDQGIGFCIEAPLGALRPVLVGQTEVGHLMRFAGIQ